VVGEQHLLLKLNSSRERILRAKECQE